MAGLKDHMHLLLVIPRHVVLNSSSNCLKSFQISLVCGKGLYNPRLFCSGRSYLATLLFASLSLSLLRMVNLVLSIYHSTIALWYTVALESRSLFCTSLLHTLTVSLVSSR
jgi:hypothetical protein